MIAPRLITSLASYHRITACDDFLEAVSGQEVVVISATRLAADELARAFCLRHGSAVGIHRFSLGALAVEIASPRLADSGKAVLAGVAVDALAARAVQESRNNAPLAWFEPVANTPGFFRALAATLSELRMAGVDNDALRKSGLAGADLALLMADFDRYLADSGLADSSVIYQTAAAAVAAGDYRYKSFPIVFLDVPVRTTAERRFIERLVAGAGPVLAAVHARDERSISCFEHAFDSGAEFVAAEGANALCRLRTQMFVTSAAEGEPDETVEFRSATDEARECVEIARAILAGAEKTPFDRTAILLRHPEPYQPLVEDALRRAGIPGFFTQGTRRPNPAGRALLALIECAAERLSATRFSEYLSLGQTPEPDERGEPPKRDPAWVPVQGELFPDLRGEPASAERRADQSDASRRDAKDHAHSKTLRTPQHWERLLVDAAVIGGRDRWVRRLEGLAREFEKQIEELRGEDDARATHVERQLERLSELRKFALPIIEFLDDLPESATWGEWLDAMERLAALTLREPEAVLSTLAELRPMSSLGPVALDEVREVLTNRLTFLRTEPTERRYGKVFVGTIPEAAGLCFDAVFLPGLGEDLFPRRNYEDPLLLDAARTSISAALATQDQRVAQERLLLHIAAGAAEHRLWISYPRMNAGQGRSRGPSFYAIEVRRAVTGHVPDLQELQRVAADASQSQPGWPSPKNPRDAIDAAEYDLAVIRDLARRPLSERRGRARYLLTANENLQRSLQTRWHRWSPKWTDADGVVDPDSATMEKLARQTPRQRPFSATALQQFAMCPYRFVLAAIHRLELRPEAVALERLDPLTRGRLFHEVQFRLLSKLQTLGELPITKANSATIHQVASEVFDATANEYRELVSPAIPRVWETEMENLRWDLRGWIDHVSQTDDGWMPKWFELAFGIGSPAITLADGTHIRGAIDLVEEKDGALRITDHKTGRAQPPFGFTGRGEILQPLIYAEAAQSLLGKPAELTRLYYCTQRGGYTINEVAVTDVARSNLSAVIDAIEQSILKGFLPAAPRKEACTWCDYKIVCGPYEEMRWPNKRQDRLQLLEQIRS